MPFVPTGWGLLARPGPACGVEPIPPPFFAPALKRSARRVLRVGFVPPGMLLAPLMSMRGGTLRTSVAQRRESGSVPRTFSSAADKELCRDLRVYIGDNISGAEGNNGVAHATCEDQDEITLGGIGAIRSKSRSFHRFPRRCAQGEQAAARLCRAAHRGRPLGCPATCPPATWSAGRHAVSRAPLCSGPIRILSFASSFCAMQVDTSAAAEDRLQTPWPFSSTRRQGIMLEPTGLYRR